MKINKKDYYSALDYSPYINDIISFPEFLKKNDVEISEEDFKNYADKCILKKEIQNLFSKYIQKIHTDLKWVCDVIEEYKKDMYFHLLHIANASLKINYSVPNFKLSNAENLTIVITKNFQFTTEALIDIETSKRQNENIPNHGYRVFLEFKTYLLEESRNKVKTKPVKKLSNPEKIAVLYKIGIEETLNKFPIKEDKYRFIHELIGGDYSNIKKVMMAGVTNENERIAQDFINSKTY